MPHVHAKKVSFGKEETFFYFTVFVQEWSISAPVKAVAILQPQAQSEIP